MERRMWEDRILMDREGLTSNHDILEFYKRDVEVSHTSQSDEAFWSVSTSRNMYKENDGSSKVSEMRKMEQIAVEFKKTMQIYEETQSSVMSVKEVKQRETSKGATDKDQESAASVSEVKGTEVFTGGTEKDETEMKRTETSTGGTGKAPEEETGNQNPGNCQASGHEYCQNCRSGPLCCVDLVRHNLTSDPSSTSLSQASSSSSSSQSDESDSDVESVISIHLGRKDEQNCAVVEYEFYINDDDEEDGVEYDSVRDNEDEVEGLVDDEDENAGEEYGYPSDDEMEYCVDDDDYDDDEEEERDVTEDAAGRSLSRASGVNRYSYYQEPLEVILEILGEEGEEEEKAEKQTVVSHRLSRWDHQEDLMTFSSSDEVTPARKEESQIERNIVVHEATSCDQVSDTQNSQNSFHNNNEVLCNRTNTQSSASCDGLTHNSLPTKEIHTLLTHSQISCNSDKQESSQSQIKGEPSDSDKLRCLTSEIETYLRETTRLLESVSSYTKSSPSAKQDANPSECGLVDTAHEHCVSQGTESAHSKDLIENNINKLHNEGNQSVTAFEYVDYEKGITHIQNLHASIQSHLSYLTNSTLGKSNEYDENEEYCTHTEGKSKEDQDRVSQKLEGERNQLKTQNNMGIKDGTRHSYKVNEESISLKTEHGKIHHQKVKSDEISGTTVKEEASHQEMLDTWTSCTESQEFYQTIKETENHLESLYFSAAEASVDAVDALDWEEKRKQKTESHHTSRIIYKPPERSQEDDHYFTNPNNNQEYWETAFEDFEGNMKSSVNHQTGSQSSNVQRQNKKSCKPPSSDTPNSLDSSFETPDYVNIESIRRSSRSESPPPTVSCLDNLEKLYRRMSQEYDLDIIDISETDSITKDKSKSHLQDVRRETFKTLNKSSCFATSDDYMDVVNQNTCSPQTRSTRDVQNLHNTTFKAYDGMADTVGNKLVTNSGQVENKDVCREKSPDIENAYEARVRENVRHHASSGDTRRFSQRTEIRNKLEEIFRKVETNASLSTCTENIGQFSTYSLTPGKTASLPPNTAGDDAPTSTVAEDIEPASTTLKYTEPKDEIIITEQNNCSLNDDDLTAATDVQLKLNEILDGLDVMYERYMKKRRNALHECSTPSNRESYIEMDETTNSSDESCLHKTTHKTTTEQSSFKDIIDISEDLKHICVFHVNKPATEPNTRTTTPQHSNRNSLNALDLMTRVCEDTDTTERYYRQSGQYSQTNSQKTIFTKHDQNGNPGGQREDGVYTEGDTVTFLTTMREKNRLCYTAALQYLELLMTATSAHEQMANPASALSSDTSQSQNMSALQMAAEGRDYLMWCPDQEFDNAVSALDIRGLVELVQTLQDAMAVEQQTFDSLSQQLEVVTDPLQQQRLSAALCTSQTRLARLCSRNMRCFRQQALKVRQKETASSESRSSSPRDSGLTVSSAAASDTEGDPRSPPAGPSFRNSLAFFQRAAHLVANNAKNTSLGARQKETRRRSSRGSSCYGSSSSEAWSVASDDQGAEFCPNGSGGVDGESYEDDLALMDDPGTYEQVLFINGRPQYQDDISWTGKRSRSNSWTRVSIDGSTGQGGSGAGGADSQPLSVPPSHPSLPGRSPHIDPPSVLAAEAHTQTQVEDVASSNVTLPRRKPYLNFKSVSSSSSNTGSECDRDNLSLFKERIGIGKYNSALDTLTRAQSFKEGLNYYTSDNTYNTSGLSRTQSFNDGLASEYNEFSSASNKATKLQRAPSVDEILESVKYLRAKKTMVKSTPDLASVQEPVYSSASLPRHKSSKSKSSRASGTSTLLGVKYNGHTSNPHYDRVPEPDYEHIPDSANTAYYENLCKGNNHYENIHLTGEVIYDSPRPTNSHHHYDKVHNDLHYENVKYDAPVYENLEDKEPTYMNVDSGGGKSNIYTNVESSKKTGSLKSLKSRSNKVTVSGNSVLQGATYDVPRAATHIYDSPQKQIRSVPQSSEYDTPKNNRSVLPQSTQIVLKAKHDQKKKIDDIFADCDQDSLEGDRDRGPDIPSPDYGSEEEEDGFEDATNDYVSSEFPDEGLGESDTRSYYTEDPAGLEVILEEPEEEYCSSHVSEDDLQREVDITYELKGERRSLDGSEGIGSAEGDTQSSGGSEHYGEEDCASSGIHSEDTPSPGPPVDADKDRHPSKQQQQQQQQKREDDRTQKDRCVEVYPETVRQRQRNMMAAANKVDIKNWNSSGPNNNNHTATTNNNNDTLTSPSKVKKFLPSVKALRNQFETGKANGISNSSRPETNGTTATTNGNGTLSQSRKSSTSNSSLASSTVDNKSSSTNSLHSPSASVENLIGSPGDGVKVVVDRDEPVEPIFNQFKKVDEELRELMSKPPSTTGWNPRSLLKRLYYIPDAPRLQSQGTTYVNIEGYLEKLPSGRKKATFWNAWKRRYFVAKDGVLYYYQGNQTEKPSMKMSLMGGRVESMDPNMVGVDDGKGHYVVVRCTSRQEAERWRRALETHTVEDFASQYVQPWPMPTNPTLLRDTLVIDIGSASIRAGILASQATLPQLFMPSVVANSREGRRQVWGFDALAPEVRSGSSIAFPIRPSQKISKYSVDLSAVSSLLQKTFAELKVDPKNYHIQLSVPRVLNTNTQAELLRVLFDKHGVRSVNLTHQSILALYAYNATSGIVVDVGERMDIVPVIDGYIVDGGVSRVPYGGYRILDHLRQFLYMRNVSLINEVESYIIRHVLENVCYSAHHYNTEKARCTANPDSFEKTVSLKEYFSKDCPYESISLDFGRFQSTEGLFNPDAWGLDHPGLHKLVHKAIMECSMDIRKEMSRSIFLAGGVTQMPGLVDRLTTEIDNLTPPAIRPKVHASPYRYHAAYIGACVLAESPAFAQSRITKEDWTKYGNASLRKWSL